MVRELKKKILSVVVLSALFMGTVSASSINGEFKGNPIVKLKSNGQVLPVEDTPAVIYEGRTMVPIYMLRKLGAEVTWNEDDFSVDVNLSHNKTADVVELARKYKSKGVTYVQTSSDGNDFISLVFMLNKSLDEFIGDAKLFGEILIESANSNSSWTVVETSDGQEFSVLTDAVRDLVANVITQEQLESYYRINGTLINERPATSTPPPQSTIPSQSTTPSVIQSKIDGDFEGFEEGKLFKLLNGQIWEQTDFTYKYVYKFSPKVLIYKDGTSYVMSVDGVDKKVKVRQIK